MSRTFDAKELMERLDNDWDFLAETVQMLVTDGRGLMDEIKQAVDAGDAAALGRAGHTIKGMISNFCAAPAQAAALEVEKVGKSGDLATAPPAVQSLESHLDALVNELNTFLSTRS